MLDQGAGLVLCRHHDGHAAHAGDVCGRDRGGGQGEGRDGGGGASLLAVGLWQRLGLGQLGVALRPGHVATVGADLGSAGALAAWQRAAVAVAKVVWRGGAVALRRPVACRAASCDDGGSVGGRALGVLLQLLVAVVVVVVVVEGRRLLVVWAGGDGGQGAVFGDDVGAHTALGPGDPLGGLSVLPGGGESHESIRGVKHSLGTKKKKLKPGRGAAFHMRKIVSGVVTMVCQSKQQSKEQGFRRVLKSQIQIIEFT